MRHTFILIFSALLAGCFESGFEPIANGDTQSLASQTETNPTTTTTTSSTTSSSSSTTSTTTTSSTTTSTSTTTTSSTTTTTVRPPAAGVWYQQNWTFANAAEMRASSDIGETYERGGSVSILNNMMIPDLDTGYPTSASAFRVQFDGNQGAEPQVGTNIFLPRARTDRPREIWVEVYVRFSSNWDTNGPFFPSPTYTSGHKFLFLFDQNQTGLTRWESMIGQFDSRGIYTGIAGGCATSSCTKDFSPNYLALFDGQWHRFRYHARMHPTQGKWELDIDGQKFSWGTGDSDFGSDLYFNQIALSRNMNTGTSQTQTLDFGPLRVFVSDPGW